MTQGCAPHQLRRPFRAPTGWTCTGPTLPDIPPETVAGWHPDRPQLGKPSPDGWSVSQTTHTPAPISVEMLVGAGPLGPWLPFSGPKVGWSISQTTHVSAPISVEMLAGTHPDRAVFPFSAHAGWIATVPQSLDIPPETVIGWHPDRPQLGKPFPAGWSVAQTTHVSAPFSVEMTSAMRPETARFSSGSRRGVETFGFGPDAVPVVVTGPGGMTGLSGVVIDANLAQGFWGGWW